MITSLARLRLSQLGVNTCRALPLQQYASSRHPFEDPDHRKPDRQIPEGNINYGEFKEQSYREISENKEHYRQSNYKSKGTRAQYYEDLKNNSESSFVRKQYDSPVALEQNFKHEHANEPRSQYKKSGFTPQENKFNKGGERSQFMKHAALHEELKNDPDTFGNYTTVASKLDLTTDDPEDVKERRRRRISDRKVPAYYIDVIKCHLDKHEFDKALAFLEERMLKIDKVTPDSYIYDLLISYCGRTGNVKQAFQLYNQIKRRNYQVTGGQYTSLFNAAANSRNSKLALDIASKVRKYLREDQLHKANIKNYNSMLKAFGRHGEMKTCLEIMDEVIERRGKVQEDTYNFLLQACVTDTNSGFRHALLVWHKLLQNKTDPSRFSFNLLLRVVRDCSIGPPQEIHHVIQTIISEKSTRFLRKLQFKEVKSALPPSLKERPEQLNSMPDENNALINTGAAQIIGSRVDGNEDSAATQGKCQSKDSITESRSSSSLSENVDARADKMLVANNENEVQLPIFKNNQAILSLREEAKIDLPNLMALSPQMGSVVDLATFTTPYHRLLLLGGAIGFIQVMDSLRIKPDMKTFTLLLDVIPSTTEAEEDLMEIIEGKKVAYDCAFFSALIKKRNFRFDVNGGKEVLHLMQRHNIAPDLMTFGCLALGCRLKADGEALIASVRQAGFRLNSEILGALVRHATYQEDLQYVRMILNAMKEDDVRPSAKLLAMIDDFMKQQHHRLQSV